MSLTQAQKEKIRQTWHMRDQLALQHSQELRKLAFHKAYDVARLIKKELPSCMDRLFMEYT